MEGEARWPVSGSRRTEGLGEAGEAVKLRSLLSRVGGDDGEEESGLLLALRLSGGGWWAPSQGIWVCEWTWLEGRRS